MMRQEQPAHAVLYSSGLAAAFALLSHFLPRRIFISGGYHGTHQARRMEGACCSEVIAQLLKISDGKRCEKQPLKGPKELLGPGFICTPCIHELGSGLAPSCVPVT